jgi:hypothetical protein
MIETSKVLIAPKPKSWTRLAMVPACLRCSRSPFLGAQDGFVNPNRSYDQREKMKYNVRSGSLMKYKFEVGHFGHGGNIFAWRLSADIDRR